MYDALIIGGGPAGATIGLQLAKAGWTVAIVEKKIFPRRKVCGEYMSAATLSLIPELDVGKKFSLLIGPAIKQIELYAGQEILSSSMPQNKNANAFWGHAIGREHLDTILLATAKKSGATIWQPWAACDLLRKDDYFICSLRSENELKNISAKIVIMAHGSWEKQAWRNIVHKHQASDLLAFKAHFIDSKLSFGSMPLLAFPGGYGGIVHTDNGRTSLSCCIRRYQLKTIRHQYAGMQAGDAVLQYLFEKCRGVRECLSSAEREGSWLSVGPIQPGIRTAYENGIFYVGNIAGEAHPIIAEGISMAIQSSWILARILFAHKQGNEKNWLVNAGIDYQKLWRKTFARRIRAAALFAQLASSQNAINLLLPFIRRYPNILSWGAKLSGKITTP